jgi:hypothetical protein
LSVSGSRRPSAHRVGENPKSKTRLPWLSIAARRRQESSRESRLLSSPEARPSPLWVLGLS